MRSPEEVRAAEGWREGPAQPPAEWQLLGLGEACTPTDSRTKVGLTAPSVEPLPEGWGRARALETSLTLKLQETDSLAIT